MNWIMSTYIIAVTHIKCVIVVDRSNGRSVKLHAYVLRFIYSQKAMKKVSRSQSVDIFTFSIRCQPAQRRATNSLFAFCANSSLSCVLWRSRSRYVCTIIIDNPSANTFRTLTRQKCNENTRAMNKHINLLLLHHNLWILQPKHFFVCECDVFIVSHHELAVRLMSPGRLTCPEDYQKLSAKACKKRIAVACGFYGQPIYSGASTLRRLVKNHSLFSYNSWILFQFTS